MPFDQMNLFADLPNADYRDSLTAADRLTLQAARAILAQLVGSRPLISSWSALTDYLAVTMGGLRAESFRVLYLDRKNHLIADEEQARGTVDHVPVYSREIARRAIQLDASAVILAHNHPSGDPAPSQADISMTLDVQKALHALGITLHDHVITGGANTLSLRADGHF
jgi:DNA repair protein RadC